jgi:hypothetical protein
MSSSCRPRIGTLQCTWSPFLQELDANVKTHCSMRHLNTHCSMHTSENVFTTSEYSFLGASAYSIQKWHTSEYSLHSHSRTGKSTTTAECSRPCCPTVSMPSGWVSCFRDRRYHYFFFFNYFNKIHKKSIDDTVSQIATHHLRILCQSRQ